MSSKWISAAFAAIVSCVVLIPAARAGQCPPPLATPTPEALQQLRAQARDHGFLWKVSKGGHDSWLYGTLHVGKLEWSTPGPQVVAALRRSDVIAVELDLADAATMEKLAEFYQRDAGRVPESLEARFKAQLDRVCLPESALDEMNPTLLLDTVSVLMAREIGLEAELGSENILGGYAKAANKEVVALETPESQMALLLTADGEDKTRELDDALQQLEGGNAKDVQSRLATAWGRSDLAELERYEHWCQCLETPLQRAEMKALLDDRNEPMARSIEALHMQGRSLFVAVGALHMIGRSGLPALLAARGYTVTRVEFAP